MKLEKGKPISQSLANLLTPIISTVAPLNELTEKFNTNKQAIRNILYRNINVSDENEEMILEIMRTAFRINLEKKTNISKSNRELKKYIKTA